MEVMATAGRITSVRQLAHRRGRGVRDGIAAGKGLRRIQRAVGQHTRRPAAHVRLNLRPVRSQGSGRLGPGFQRPLLDGTVNLTEVVNARVLLRSRTRLQEVGNRDRSQKADNGHHDHNFHQCKTRFTGRIDFHTAFFLLWAA